jgi:hypothetical protein
MSTASVDEFRLRLDEQTLATVDALRSIIAGVDDGLTEHIKWNAPSFVLAGDDRITLGIERNGGVRVVLHRGAKPKDVTNFRFADFTGLAKWPAPDRGVIVFKDNAHVESCREKLQDLCARWLAVTS